MSEESVLAIILHRMAMAFKGLVGPASKTLFLILIFSLEITAEIKGMHALYAFSRQYRIAFKVKVKH